MNDDNVKIWGTPDDEMPGSLMVSLPIAIGPSPAPDHPLGCCHIGVVNGQRWWVVGEGCTLEHDKPLDG